MGIKTAFTLCVGFALGFTASYIIMKDRMADQTQAEVNEVKAAYKKKLEKELGVKSQVAEGHDPKEIWQKAENGKVNYSRAKKIANENDNAKAEINLVQPDENYEDAEGEDPSDEDSEDLDDYHKYNSGYEYLKAELPYQIREEEFKNEHSDYDKIVYFYYAKDDTLMEEDDDSDSTFGIEEIFGVGWRDLFDSDNQLYLRNESVQADFSITKLNEYYSRRGD